MRIVVALGGNALLRRGENPDAAIQLGHIRTAAEALAPLAAHHELIVCHGNGQHGGMLALESENDASLTHPYPLDVLVARTQGIIGYWLVQELRNAGVTKPVLGILTQTVVDASDPAFARPTKFVGPVHDQPNARRLADLHGWNIGLDGEHWRRVVPSPRPERILEQATLTHLLRQQAVIVCGGGVPVTEDGYGRIRGVEAVVDKDFTAALLAITVRADRLLVLTDVPGVMRHFGTPQATLRKRIDVDDLAAIPTFPAGSMGPKINACARFVTTTGRRAAIGSLSQAAAVLDGSAGTTITAHPVPVRRPSVLRPHGPRKPITTDH
ncbi:carbamate kinase [Streptomyces sp. NBC_00433]